MTHLEEIRAAWDACKERNSIKRKVLVNPMGDTDGHCAAIPAGHDAVPNAMDDMALVKTPPTIDVLAVENNLLQVLSILAVKVIVLIPINPDALSLPTSQNGARARKGSATVVKQYTCQVSFAAPVDTKDWS